MLVAALAVAVIPFVARPFLDATVRELDSASVGAVVGSFVAALALFAVPVTLLGTVSPFAIRLALPAVEHAGTTAGRLYALSTIGSILGTFASRDRRHSVRRHAANADRDRLCSSRSRPACCSGRAGSCRRSRSPRCSRSRRVRSSRRTGVLYEGESRYQYIDVRERDDGSRVLELNEGVVANSIWYPDGVLTGGEWDMFLVVPPLVAHPVRRRARPRQRGRLDGTRARRALPGRPRSTASSSIHKVTDVARRFLGSARSPACTSSRPTRAHTFGARTSATTRS